MSVNIMITGVGGQGTLLASRLFGAVTMANGLDVKVSEVHGMSQRGGSVVTYVKYGDAVHSPVIDRGEADYILAFERLEAARHLAYLKPGGTMIVNDQRITPMPVITGAMRYPEDIIEKMKDASDCDIIALDALALATEAGDARSVNVVLLGVISKLLEFPESDWISALERIVRPQFVDMNKRAFALGQAQL